MTTRPSDITIVFSVAKTIAFEFSATEREQNERLAAYHAAADRAHEYAGNHRDSYTDAATHARDHVDDAIAALHDARHAKTLVGAETLLRSAVNDLAEAAVWCRTDLSPLLIYSARPYVDLDASRVWAGLSGWLEEVLNADEDVAGAVREPMEFLT